MENTSWGSEFGSGCRQKFHAFTGFGAFLEILDSCIAFLFLLFITALHPVERRGFLSEVSSPLWSRLSAVLVDVLPHFGIGRRLI
jgi:hypothetical protein